MTAHWYCLINDREHGPFTSQKIQRLAEKGKLRPEHSVRPETDSHWTPASAIPGLFPDGAANAAPPIAKAAPPKVVRKPSHAGQTSPPTAVAAAVPKAIPVPATSATPVATPAAQPVLGTACKQAVARGVATPVATPVAQPVATPTGDVSGPVPSGVAIPPRPPAARYSGGDYTKRGRRKSQQLYIVVGSLAGVLVALGSVALFVMMKGPPKDTPSRPKASTPSAANANVPSPDPKTGDPELDPYQDSAASQETANAATFPTLGRWLDATRQKGGLRGVAKLEVAGAWTEKPAAGARVLNIDVKITNLAADDSLDFRGFSGGEASGVNTMALLSDEQGVLLQQLPVEKSSGRGAAVRRIKSDQSHTERLRFSLGDNTSGSFRLALPYASLGQTGYLGFELPILMIKDHPPGAESSGDAATTGLAEGDAAAPPREESDQPAVESRDQDGQDGVEGESDAVPEAFRSGNQPGTINDLLRSIEGEGEDADGDGDGDGDAESTGGTLP